MPCKKLQELKKAIEENKRLGKKEERKELEEKLNEEREETLALKYEKARRGIKQGVLDEILGWARKFSPELKKISGEEKYQISIFHSSWGHCYEKDKYNHSWSEVILYDGGKLDYKAGTSGIGGSTTHALFELNEENLDLIKYEYLRELSRAIKSRKVYDTIKEEIARKSIYFKNFRK